MRRYGTASAVLLLYPLALSLPLRYPSGMTATLAPDSKSRKHLRDLLIASVAISFLTIIPPMITMQVVDRVLAHHSYSTLFLISIIVAVLVLYETLLGYARRLIILVVGVRTDATLNLHVFNRLVRLPLYAGMPLSAADRVIERVYAHVVA